ncbi:hypothetical protein CBM2634_B50009 [Cupriavidus taiwanensis]|uniref:Uncharacterized protein n=1 Tax=Cupriavidus taiwanensis TaxID=164546 RepID=A0A375J9H0_9BURK|nr:hypothetical protein CBM2634_B50009 [Cupriavidus taiwanensis]
MGISSLAAPRRVSFCEKTFRIMKIDA